ncbi:MAG: hypothetical protein KC486_20475 [Myxococcales bacterium]|nr:hypothetical protein [Myxococcales bacterium]
MVRVRAWPLAASLLVAHACAASGDSTGRAPRSDPAADFDLEEVDAPPVVSDVDAPPTADLTWHRIRFAEAGIDLDVVDLPHSTHAWEEGGGVLSQRIYLDDQPEPIALLIRAGEGVSLDEFRRDHSAKGVKTSRVRHGTTCGQPSRHLELYAPEVIIECIEFADGRPSEPGYIPPMTFVAEAFRYGDLDVVVRWEIPTALRERYRDDERRFFASLTCP